MSQFKVSGLKCGGCAARLSKAIQSADATADIAVDVATGDVRVHASSLGAERIADLITAAGFGILSEPA